MSILVTGGAGYIGSHIVLQLLKSGHSVIVIDDCSNCVILNSEDVPESLKRVQTLAGKKLLFDRVDLKHYESVRQVFLKHPDIRAVIHLAAMKAVGESCRIPLAYYENNVMGTINLLKCMKENSVCNFIFSSSATVYGVPQYLPIDELHPTGSRITNPYGRSKFFMEEILKDEVTASPDLSVISLRYFNPVGAHESGEIGEDPKGIPNNLVPFIAQVAVGRLPHLSVYGSDYQTPDGTGIRDYIHIMDLADGHVVALDHLLIQSQRLGFEAINLGSGFGYSVLQMIAAFEQACGRKIAYQIVDRRDGDVDSTFADCQKANRVLKWSAKLDLNRMCIDTWRWQSKYPNGFACDNNNVIRKS
jgi:UDP-glucose 4-epimerase